MIDKFWNAMDTQCDNLLVAVPKLEVTLENVVVCQIQPTCVSLGSYSEQKSFHCCKMINHWYVFRMKIFTKLLENSELLSYFFWNKIYLIGKSSVKS